MEHYGEYGTSDDEPPALGSSLTSATKSSKNRWVIWGALSGGFLLGAAYAFYKFGVTCDLGYAAYPRGQPIIMRWGYDMLGLFACSIGFAVLAVKSWRLNRIVPQSPAIKPSGMASMKMLKRPLVLLLLIYLVFDLRPLLLIPNLLLYWKPCAKYAVGAGAFELRVFPRLCIAGDPIRVAIRSHDLPLGHAFGRTYDRSGIFYELQFSGTINNTHPIETLYWTMGLSGGLGGDDVIPEKDIWLGDYIHFDKIGRYQINLRYQDSLVGMNNPPNSGKRVDYKLSDFSLIYLPENPVSKFLKQTVLAIGMFLPADTFRAFAVKWLGYQETAFSTYALGQYYSTYGNEAGSTVHPYANSVFETYRGTMRDYDYCTVGKVLRRFENGLPYSLLGTYFHFHFCRLILPLDTHVNPPPAEVTQANLANLIEYIYPSLNQTNKDSFIKTANYFRNRETDEYWQTLIDKLKTKEAQATNQTEIANLGNRRQWAETNMADKKGRDFRLRLIDYALTEVQKNNRKIGGAAMQTAPR